MSDLSRVIASASSGLKAQSGRMRLIAENLANSGSTPEKAGEPPYRRKIATFRRMLDRETGAETVGAGRTARDQRAFPTRYEPGHPAADADGYVKQANVNALIEQADLREAQRSYEANLNVIGAARRMIARTLEILKA